VEVHHKHTKANEAKNKLSQKMIFWVKERFYSVPGTQRVTRASRDSAVLSAGVASHIWFNLSALSSYEPAIH